MVDCGTDLFRYSQLEEGCKTYLIGCISRFTNHMFHNVSSPISTGPVRVASHILHLLVLTTNQESAAVVLGYITLYIKVPHLFSFLQMLDGISTVFQLTFGKYILMFILNLAYVLTTKQKNVFMMKSNVLTHIVFTLSILGLTLFSFQAVLHVAAGTSICITYLSFMYGMMIIYLFSKWWDRDNITSKWILIEFVSLATMFVALVFIIQPYGMFQSIPYFRERTNYTSCCNVARFQGPNGTELEAFERTVLYQSYSWRGYLFAFLAGLCNTISVVCNKEMLKYEEIHVVVLWASGVNAIISLICTLSTGGFVFPLDTLCMSLIVMHALSSGAQNNAFIMSIKYISSTNATVIATVTIGLLLFFQFTFLSSASPVPANVVAIVASLIFFSVTIAKPLLQVFVAYKDVK